MALDPNAFKIRDAQAADDDALRRLAELDSSPVPGGRLLVGELEGEVVAAVPVAGGPAIADPFRATSTLISLLGLRAAQLRSLQQRWKSHPSMLRLIPAAGADKPHVRTNPIERVPVT
jgi:hypothetical protein